MNRSSAGPMTRQDGRRHRRQQRHRQSHRAAPGAAGRRSGHHRPRPGPHRRRRRRRSGPRPARSVHAFTADLSAQAQVRRLAAELLDALPRIDVLVNNAGGYWNTRHVTADGLERTFAVNHLAPVPPHRPAPRPRSRRATTVAWSPCHPTPSAIGRIDFDDLQGEHAYSGARAYNQSKLANILFTHELAGRLEGTGVTANALHPGVVRTSFGAEDPGLTQRLVVPLARPFMRSPHPGAATSVLLASSRDLKAVTGQFFISGRQRRSSRRSYDDAVARRLWRASEALVELR